MARFGGEIIFSFAGGRKLTMRGDFTVKPAGFSAEAITNQDGSVSQSATLMPHGWEGTFEDAADLDWEELMRLGDFEVTAREDYTGVSHLFGPGFFVGEPSINRKTGEVSGLSGAHQSYRKI
ncbi:phage tail tube protein [Afifella aestuarii]|uniref:phage tail tube protein n=1 Tax=Afifella aestuarii TaxID=1909496 RepID=UPI000FE35D54|nr:phage tail tube protein [Afifella aestuarii]